MNNNLIENKNKATGSDVESSLYNADKLISISVQAKFLSWFILAVSILFFIILMVGLLGEILGGSSYGYGSFFYGITYVFGSFLPVLIGLVLYVILRSIAECILLFMDIEFGLREMNERKR